MIYETVPGSFGRDGIRADGLYFEFTDEYRSIIPFGLIPKEKNSTA